jgi:hypothetical protein
MPWGVVAAERVIDEDDGDDDGDDDGGGDDDGDDGRTGARGLDDDGTMGWASGALNASAAETPGCGRPID